MTTKTTFDHVAETAIWAVTSGIIGAAVVEWGHNIVTFIPPSSYGFFPTAATIAVSFGVAKVVEQYASKKFGAFAGSITGFVVQGGIVVGLAYFNLLPLSISPLCPLITGLFFFIYQSKGFHLEIKALQNKPSTNQKELEQTEKINNLESAKKDLEEKLEKANKQSKEATTNFDNIKKQLEELQKKQEEQPKVIDNPQQKEELEKLQKEKQVLQNQLLEAVNKTTNANKELIQLKKELLELQSKKQEQQTITKTVIQSDPQDTQKIQQLTQEKGQLEQQVKTANQKSELILKQLQQQLQSKKEEPKTTATITVPQSDPKDLQLIEQLKKEKELSEQQLERANEKLDQVQKELQEQQQKQLLESKKDDKLENPFSDEFKQPNKEQLELVEKLQKENEELKRSLQETMEKLKKEQNTEETLNKEIVRDVQELSTIKLSIETIIKNYNHAGEKGATYTKHDRSAQMIKDLKLLLPHHELNVPTLKLSELKESPRDGKVSPKDTDTGKTSPKGIDNTSPKKESHFHLPHFGKHKEEPENTTDSKISPKGKTNEGTTVSVNPKKKKQGLFSLKKKEKKEKKTQDDSGIHTQTSPKEKQLHNVGSISFAPHHQVTFGNNDPLKSPNPTINLGSDDKKDKKDEKVVKKDEVKKEDDKK